MAPLFSLSVFLNLYIKLTVDELVLGDGATLVLVQGPEQVHGPLPEKHVAYNNK